MTKVLLVEDEADALLSLSRALKAKEPALIIEGVASAERALEYLEKNDPEVVLIDLSLDVKKGVESGFDLLKAICISDNRCKVIVLTGHSSVENGVRALSMGASHFIEKPPDIIHLAALIKDCAKQSEMFRAYKTSSKGVHSVLLSLELVGSSREVETLREDLLFAASTNQSVLLVGETGTGKTLCAALVHKLSARSSRKFVCYTPAYHNADLVNSDLFGHLKGSFTGAAESRTGLLSEADGGTFFLDEVDELPQETQISLLRVIQNKHYRMLGSNKDEQANFRLITATNRKQEELVQKDKLREDFYHRIAHKVIRLPALRERRADIRQLAESFLQALCRKEEVRVFSFEAAAFEKLENYSWLGNVRELEAVVEGAAYLAQFKGRSEVLAQDLKLEVNKVYDSSSDGGKSFHELVEGFKQKLVHEAMEQSGRNQVQACKLLGLDRSGLRRILGKE